MFLWYPICSIFCINSSWHTLLHFLATSSEVMVVIKFLLRPLFRAPQIVVFAVRRFCPNEDCSSCRMPNSSVKFLNSSRTDTLRNYISSYFAEMYLFYIFFRVNILGNFHFFGRYRSLMLVGATTTVLVKYLHLHILSIPKIFFSFVLRVMFLTASGIAWVVLDFLFPSHPRRFCFEFIFEVVVIVFKLHCFL